MYQSLEKILSRDFIDGVHRFETGTPRYTLGIRSYYVSYHISPKKATKIDPVSREA